MSFCLQTKIIKPEKEDEIKNAIILLHGYGGDGNDISTITINWKRFLPNTIFLCPNGHEKCTINPDGYQWFDLSRDDPNYILEQSLKAEKLTGKSEKAYWQIGKRRCAAWARGPPGRFCFRKASGKLPGKFGMRLDFCKASGKLTGASGAAVL